MLNLESREGMSRSSLRADALRARAHRGNCGSAHAIRHSRAIQPLLQWGECESIFMRLGARIDD